MKTIIQIILISASLSVTYSKAAAQNKATEHPSIKMGIIKPYQTAVTYQKTTHLIFPAPIRYVDLGSDLLIAGKAEDAANVLRIKAAVKDFEEETNFSVITEDGCFYSFDVYYSPYPETLNYDLSKLDKAKERQVAKDVLFRDLGNSAPSLTALIMKTIYQQNRHLIKHLNSKGYGIQFSLKGIYIHNGKLYFHTELRNKSNLPFHIDFLSFKIVDKKIAKRTVLQAVPIKPLRMYASLDPVAGNSKAQNVFLLDQFTLAADQVLLIEIFEKNGGRHQVLSVENSDLVNGKLLKDLHLNIN